MGQQRITIILEGRDEFSDEFRKLSEALKTTQADTRDLGTAAQSPASGFDSLGKSVWGAVSAFGALAIAQTVIQLRDVGDQAHRTNTLFIDLAGGTEGAAQSLEQLRTVTRGVVEDQVLMDSANRLLTMRLAETSDEAARLTGIAVTLGQTMGMDATTAAQDFALMLANQSIERLDAFGISAGRVREQVEALIDAGMTREDAFMQAVLDEGESSLNRLADSIDQSATSFDRLGARIRNAYNDLGDFMRRGVEAGAQVIEIGFILYEEAQAERRNREDYRSIAQAAIGENVSGRVGAGRVDAGTQVAEAIVPLLETNAELATAVDRLYERVDSGELTIDQANIQAAALLGNVELANMPEFAQVTRWFADITVDMNARNAEAAENQRRAQEAYERQLVEEAQLERERQRAAAAAAAGDPLQGTYRERRLMDIEEATIVAGRVTPSDPQSTPIFQRSQQQAGYYNQFDTLTSDALLTLNSGVQRGGRTDLQGNTIGGVSFMSYEDADRLRASADEAERLAVAAETAQDTLGFTLFSEEQVQGFRDSADAIARLADEAERGAEALARASVGDLLGQSDGGRLGELTDMVLSAGQAQGLDLGTFEAEADLRSGRQTEASVAMQAFVDDVLAPLAATDPELAALAARNLEDTMTTMAELGIDPAILDTRSELLEAANLQRDGGAGSYAVQPGDGWWTIAQRTGMSEEELRALNPGVTMLHPEDTLNLGGGYRAGTGYDARAIATGLGTSPAYTGGGTSGPTPMMGFAESIGDDGSMSVGMTQVSTETSAIAADMQATESAIVAIDGTLPAIATTAGDIATRFADTKLATADIRSDIEWLTTGTRKLRLELELTGPFASTLAAANMRINRDNGGRPVGLSGNLET